jgi:hypothetical protein
VPLEREVLPGHARRARDVQPALAQLVAVTGGLLEHARLGRDVPPEHARRARDVRPALAQLVAVPDALLGHAQPMVAPVERQVARVLRQVARVLRQVPRVWPEQLSPALPSSVPVHWRSAALPQLPALR